MSLASLQNEARHMARALQARSRARALQSLVSSMRSKGWDNPLACTKEQHAALTAAVQELGQLLEQDN